MRSEIVILLSTFFFYFCHRMNCVFFKHFSRKLYLDQENIFQVDKFSRLFFLPLRSVFLRFFITCSANPVYPLFATQFWRWREFFCITFFFSKNSKNMISFGVKRFNAVIAIVKNSYKICSNDKVNNLTISWCNSKYYYAPGYCRPYTPKIYNTKKL